MLITGNTPGNDCVFSMRDWRVPEFLQQDLECFSLCSNEPGDFQPGEDDPVELELADRWILSRLKTKSLNK